MRSNTQTENHYTFLLIVLGGAFVTGMVVTFALAGSRVTRVVDADYYTHGLHYGKTTKGELNPGLAWTMSASLSGGHLQVSVRDENGAPVCGGRLQFKPERCLTTVPAVSLAESAPGVFTAPRPLSPQGDLHGTLLFTRGDAVATHKVVLFN